MALFCNAIDQLFCGLKPCCQFFNPCVKACGCGNRKVFYNFDGSNSTEPLISYFKPTNSLARENLVKGMKLDRHVLKRGLSAVEQIATVVNFAYKNQYSVRAVGTGCSWSKLTTVRDILIDMTKLDQIIDAKPQNSVSSIYHIEVQSGMVLKDFYREIDRRYGMGLPTTPSYIKQTVGGVVSTTSHGTGQDHQSLSNFIVELHMIISRGVQVKIRLPSKESDVDEPFESVKCRIESANYGDPPIEICSADIFRAASVGLGSLGVIYSVTFECLRAYNVKEKRQNIEIKWPSKSQEPGTKSKKFKIPSELKKLSGDISKYVTILVNPYPAESESKQDKVVLKSAYFVGERSDEKVNKLCRCQLWYVDCQCYRCCTFTPDCRCRVFEEDCCTNWAHCCGFCCPSCIPTFADAGLKMSARVENHPDIDRWYKIFGFVDFNSKFRAAAYFVPLCEIDRALEDVVKLMNEYLDLGVYSLIPITVRFVKADNLYLSPANRSRCDGTVVENYAVIEVMFPVAAYGIDEFHQKIEDHLFDKYKGRPHWSKNHFLNMDRADQLYPDLDKWKRVYLLFNSDGTFDNEFTSRVGFENFRGGEGCRRNVHVCHTLGPAIQVSTVSAQQVAVARAHEQNEILASAHAQQTTAVTTEIHGDHAHVNVAKSNIIYAKIDHSGSKVVTSQPKPKKSIHFPADRHQTHHHHDNQARFVHVPLQQNRRYVVNT